MAKYTGPACKLCRREGEKLFLKGERCFTPKCAFERRSFVPGQHGPTGSRGSRGGTGRESDYAKQLRGREGGIICVLALYEQKCGVIHD
jgi:small subunit ribosomal protein S4